MIGVCLSRTPWLTVVEYMQYKDIGGVLRACKISGVELRMNELLYFPVQIVEGCNYLVEVSLRIFMLKPIQ